MSSFAGNVLETQDGQNNEGQDLPHLNQEPRDFRTNRPRENSLEQFEQHCIVCDENIQV